jgi:signal peptidase
MLQRLKKVWRVMTFVIPAALLVALVALLVMRETGHLPYKVYVIHTGSMSPTIPPKSAVVIREDQYKVGEVVAYRRDHEVITHRLMAIGPHGRITTKGDANRTADPWHVPESRIIGSVVAAPHMVGYWIVYAKNPFGLLAIALGIACLWLIVEELRENRAIRRMERQHEVTP